MARLGEIPSMHVPARPSGIETREPEPPSCPNCGDETGPESLPFTRRLRWGCCGYTERIDEHDRG